MSNTYYKCNEKEFFGIYSQEEIEYIYESIVDKKEYFDFECWITDMIKSGIITKIII